MKTQELGGSDALQEVLTCYISGRWLVMQAVFRGGQCSDHQ